MEKLIIGDERRHKPKIWEEMFRRRGSVPLVLGAVVIGVVSGKSIFGQPLDDYWKKKLEQEQEEAAAAAKENKVSSA